MGSAYSDPQWIYIDLGKEEKIEKVILKWEAACAKKYELQVSNDAQEWKTVYTNKNGRGGTEQIELEPVTARYVELAGISVPHSSDIHCSNSKSTVRNQKRSKN